MKGDSQRNRNTLGADQNRFMGSASMKGDSQRNRNLEIADSPISTYTCLNEGRFPKEPQFSSGYFAYTYSMPQ